MKKQQKNLIYEMPSIYMKEISDVALLNPASNLDNITEEDDNNVGII